MIPELLNRPIGHIPWPPYTTAAQQKSLLRLLALAVERQWPLPPLLDAFAADQRGRQRHRVTRLTSLLEQGLPLADALERIPAVVSDQAKLAARLGSQSGTLAEMLRQVVARQGTEPSAARRSFQAALVYAVFLSVFFLIHSAFMSSTILPTFRQLYQEYGIEPPGGPPPGLGAVANWQRWTAAGLVVLGLLSLGRLRRSIRSGWLAPFVGRTLAVRSAEFLDQLGIVRHHGRPLASALSTLARYHYDPSFRPRLLFVRNELEQGADLWPSLQSVGFLNRAESQLLSTSDRLGNTAWALHQIARRKNDSLKNRCEAIFHLLRVAVILGLGCVVWLYVTSIYSIIPRLVQGLS